MATMTLTPLHASLGAEVSGVDLSQPLDDATRAALSRALADHLALVFHDQSLTPPQYLAAAEAFGPPMRQHYSQHLMPDHPDIGMVWHRNGQQPAERWHTDHTNRANPPEAERARLDTLRTVNSLDGGKTDTRPEDWAKYSPPIVHPMVRTHPVHGSRAVYFHISKTLHIDGMTPEDSKAYMTDLLARMIRPEIVYHHQWRKGDVLVIDDRATMHRAHGDYDRSQNRVLWRIIAEGDRPRLV